MKKLLNTKDLVELGFTQWIISGIKIAGQQHNDSPFIGRYTTEDKIFGWLERHPDFVASRFRRKSLPN